MNQNKRIEQAKKELEEIRKSIKELNVKRRELKTILRYPTSKSLLEKLNDDKSQATKGIEFDVEEIKDSIKRIDSFLNSLNQDINDLFELQQKIKEQKALAEKEKS